MFATKTAKTAAAPTAERNAPALANFADLAAAALASYREANPAPAPVAPRRANAAPGTPVGEKHACRCGHFAVADGAETGCKGALTWRLFAPGHDAKLKGTLIRAAIAGHLVADAATGRTESAVAVAERFGFGHQVREGVALAQAKAEAKKAAKAARTAAKAAPAPQAPAAPAKPEEAPQEPAPAAPEEPSNEDLFADLLAEVQAEAAATPAAPAKPARKPRARKA